MFVKFIFESSVFWSILGKAGVGFLAFVIISKVYKLFKLYILPCTVDLKTYGKWAVVTGATDGMGKAYAMQLASKGLDLVLISRTFSRLESTANEIKNKYQDIEVKCIEADFSSTSIYPQIQKELEGLDIAVLVNNVGVGYKAFVCFHDLPDKDCQEIVTVNINSVLYMTRMVIDRMVEKRKGVIVNVASLASLIPVPLFDVYGATKAFVRSFSLSLDLEYKSKGIIVQCLSPGIVATKLARISETGFFVPSPEKFAKSALNTIGKNNDNAGTLNHELMTIVAAIVGNKLSGNYFMDFAIEFEKQTRMKKDKKE